MTSQAVDTLAKPHNVSEIASIAECLTESLCPVLLLQSGFKRPVTDAGKSWVVLDDPAEVDQAILKRTLGPDRVPNLGLLLHPRSDSSIICIDVDGSTPEVVARFRDLGVSRDDASWRQITGKGNGYLHIFYYWDGDPLPRIANRPDGVPVDLLSNGYAVIAPSNTRYEPDGGGQYRWVEGHSPRDIPVAELQRPPDSLIDWWLQRSKDPKLPAAEGEITPDGSKAWALVRRTIPESTRNETLTRIAGWLRLYHPPAVVEALLLTVNDARCAPPLSPNEVVGIVRSVARYAQPGVNGHPRAVTPMFYRAEDGE